MVPYAAAPVIWDSLADLDADLVECRRCPRLVEWREHVAREKRAAFADQEYWGRPVPGFGDPRAGLMIVGLAPAAHGANRTGRMFTGDRSGDWLYAALHRAGFANQPGATDVRDGLELTGAYVTSPVKCAPPGNKPTTDERDNCSDYFTREVELIAPKVVIALGGFGWAAALRFWGWQGTKPNFGHGAEYAIPDGPVLLGSYHVSQQNTFTGRLTEEMLDAVFTRAKAILAGKAP
ncbi:MAG TPA: uracil-DNA glycosylase [Nitriliruptorales bacterium]